MPSVVSDEIARFVRAIGPTPDETLREMDEYAAEEGFPNVGPEVGGVLSFLARAVDAERVFEFGSGYGYSAYWFARGLSEDGTIVLTEVDADELEMAREYMQRGGFDEIAEYEHGDALETIEEYDGPFDVVLLDHQKHRYADAFEAVRSKVPVGGVVVADNAMTAGSIRFDDLLEIVADGSTGTEESDEMAVETNEATRGIARYLEGVRADPAFETVALPLGEGIAVSYRIE